MTTISVCLSDDQIQALKALALATDRSASAVVRSAIEDYFDKQRVHRAMLRRRGRVGERAWEVFDLLAG
ncbi:MAG TPA: ribbon-helix-helix protein, CopG family [Solirubrobacteraceae bacterium]|jgi:predicted transcriptional regulator